MSFSQILLTAAARDLASLSRGNGSQVWVCSSKLGHRRLRHFRSHDATMNASSHSLHCYKDSLTPLTATSVSEAARMDNKWRLKIAIAGGGPGGLSLSVILGKLCNDVHIDLYEAAPQFIEVGAGISVWKRTWCILQTLGLDKSLAELTVNPPVDEPRPGFIFRKSDQVPGFYYHKNIGPFGSITLHRADMLKVLKENQPPAEQLAVHFSKHLVSYEQVSNSVTLHFEDGSTAQADVLIGADGIKSVSRAAMYEGLAREVEKTDPTRSREIRSHVDVSWTGTFGYRSLVETEKLLKASPDHRASRETLSWSGKNKHIVSYPISQGRLINLIGFVTVPGREETELDGSPVVDVPKKEMLDQYVGWEPDARILLECAEEVSRWAIFHVRGLPTYIDRRVALLGDSAHAMTTHLGAGAGQAIEDSFILGQILANPRVDSANACAALRVYDAIRRPFGNSIVERSRTAGLLYEFNGLPDGVDEDGIRSGSKEELRKLGEEIYRKWEIQWTELPDEQWGSAAKLLDETVGHESGRA